MSNVLIADDDSHISRVLSIWLRRHGFQVICVSGGLEALEVMETESICLLITDMNMPGLDGAGLVRAVREQCGQTMPIFILTARCDKERLARELQSQGVQVFSKPFLPSEMLVAVKQVLGSTVS